MFDNLSYDQYLALGDDDQRDFKERFADTFNDVADQEIQQGAKQVVINSKGEVVHIAQSDSDAWDSPTTSKKSEETGIPHFSFNGTSRIGMGSVKIREMS